VLLLAQPAGQECHIFQLIIFNLYKIIAELGKEYSVFRKYKSSRIVVQKICVAALEC